MSPAADPPAVRSQRSGPDGAPLVLLVHGIGTSGRYYTALTRELESTHQVVTPDLPGFGDSGRPRPALTIVDQAVALEEALQLKDRTGVLLVGHSMGSQVATELAARNPGLATGLILIGPVTEPPKGALRQAWRLMLDLPREPPAINAVVLWDYIRGGIRSFAGTLPHMLRYPLAARLGVVSAPVVLVRGQHDSTCSLAFLESLAAATPGARVVEIPKAAHVAMAVRPDLVAAACRDPELWTTTRRDGGPSHPHGFVQ